MRLKQCSLHHLYHTIEWYFPVNTYSLGPNEEEGKCWYRIVLPLKKSWGPFHILRHTQCNKLFSFAKVYTFLFLTILSFLSFLYLHGTYERKKICSRFIKHNLPCKSNFQYSIQNYLVLQSITYFYREKSIPINALTLLRIIGSIFV